MGPAGDGVTYRENRRAFNDYPIMPRRLQGISAEAIDLRTKLLEHDLPFPMITCPMGGHGMFHVNAEVATAGGTGTAGTLYVSSGAAHKPMEDIAKATPGPKWFQIYMNRDMEINRWLVQRARAAGFSAIVLTADALGPNPADEYVRLGSFEPPGLTQGNHDPALGGRGTFRDFKRDLSFSDIGFLREASGLPVIVKGHRAARGYPPVDRRRRRGDLGVQPRRAAARRRAGVRSRCCGRRPTRCKAGCRSSSTAASAAASTCSRRWRSAPPWSRSAGRCCGA